MECFSEFISNISLKDESKIIQKTFKFAYNFLNKFFDINHWVFFEIFDVFAEVNASDCYVVYKINQNMDHIIYLKLL